MKIKEVAFAHNTNVISEKAFKEHLKLYKGYVDKSNAIFSELNNKPGREAANKTYSIYRGLKKGETYALDGVILHELYFRNMGGDGASPCARFIALTDKFFGGFDKWAEDFIACAKSARGWCVACFEQRTVTMKNILMDSHDEGIIQSAYPLVVADLYEHAYWMDYGADSAKYIKRFMEDINWQAVGERVGALPLNNISK